MHSDSTSVASIFTEAMKALALLAEQRSPRERAELHRAIATLRTNQPHAQKLLCQAPADDGPPRLASGIVEPESSEASVLRAWGADLLQRRKAAGMTRDALAERAGISESTLRNVEKGKRPPTRTTIMHLQSVPELRIDAGPVAGLVAGKAARARSFTPNCWLAPEFDAIKLHAEMTMQLSGRGGHIEQTYLYLEPSSATAWCAIAEQESYTRVRTAMPFSQVAKRVGDLIGSAGMDLLGLGCGDGKDEIRLTQCLLEQHPGRNMRLYLLDISQPLCSLAYRHAAQVLGGHANVDIFALQGSFYNLPRYQQLLHSPQRAHRRRLLCMFGNTFASLHNEILFVRNSLLGFAPGDLLLIGVPAAMAPADQREMILKNDHALTAGSSSSARSMGGLANSFLPVSSSAMLMVSRALSCARCSTLTPVRCPAAMRVTFAPRSRPQTGKSSNSRSCTASATIRSSSTRRWPARAGNQSATGATPKDTTRTTCCFIGAPTRLPGRDRRSLDLLAPTYRYLPSKPARNR